VTGSHLGRDVADLVHERDNIAVPLVTLNFWAGARAAAGTASESVEAGSVEEALDTVLGRHDDARFTRVVRASSLLVDGVAASATSVRRPLSDPTVVEVLPPFAGG
jgi:sulfur-carrier protein